MAANKPPVFPPVYAEHAEHRNDGSTRTFEFDINDLNARIDSGVLSLDLPTFGFGSYVIAEEAHERMRSAGLSAGDIEDAVDAMLETLNIKLLAKILSERKRGR
jgi:hypothetical protein